jgi:predicted nucleic acid-binding protein
MNIVIDSNILFSALIKDAVTRRMILNYDGFFLFPSYIFDKMHVHKAELLEKSGMNAQEFDKLLHILLKKVFIVPHEVLQNYKVEASMIIREIDINDTLFIACALAYQDSVIWSNDKNLKKQSRIKVLNTSEMKPYLNK